MTRKEAAAAGERFYTSKACKHDGDTRRYTASAHCVTCSKRKGAQQNKIIRDLMTSASK